RRRRAPHGAGRGGAPLERRRARGVAPALRDRRVRGEARDRQGPGRVPRGARVPGGAVMNERVERVRAAVGEPLLVTKPVNVLYLTGLESSNAAVLVEPERVRIFTDFRYLEKARATGIEVVEIPRSLFSRLPDLLPRRVAFEAETLPYASWAALDEAGIETVPTRQLLEGVRAVKEPAE